MDKKLVNVVAAYAPQVGRSTEEKDKFWWDMMELVASYGQGEEVVIGGDLNGHVGNTAEGYEEVHGGYGYGNRNEEGERILEFCDALEMNIGNTWFSQEENKRITFESGGIKSMIDYLLMRKSEGIQLVGLEALYVGMQHKMVLGDFIMESREGDSRKKEKRKRRLRTWR